MAKASKSRSATSRKSARVTTPEPAIEQPEPAIEQSVPRPSGKLGLVVDRLAAIGGATIDELMAETGWQRHTVRAVLSRFRTRGFAARLDVQADRKAYQLSTRAS
jgi:hypothetical protein